MGIVQVSLPDELKALIERQVAEGRAVDVEAYLAEAARRYAEDLELESELVAVAEAGIADAEAGRYTTIATPEDGEAWLDRKMAKLRERLAKDKG
jgi:predicted transcriptional regulator